MHSAQQHAPKRPRKIIVASLLEIEETEPGTADSIFDDLDAAREEFDEIVYQAALVIFGRGITRQESSIENVT